MDAIWSYWSPPAGADHKARWTIPLHHLVSWTLSVSLARQWFSRLVLYTDSEGARLLVDALGLPFDEVHCLLDRIPASRSHWWALGKLYAYRAHERPFVHIDSDVYLWRALPSTLLASPVLAQNPERFPFEGSYYAPAEVVKSVRNGNGWLPEELEWYAGLGGNEACCCGILGTTRVDFIAEYADRAIALVERNTSAWTLLPPEIEPNVVVEQYLLSAFYYFQCRTQRCSDIEIGYLFSTESDAYDQHKTSAAGYTHLMAAAKEDPHVTSRLVRRVETDCPYFHHAVEIAGRLT
jgi:hypothetical protein